MMSWLSSPTLRLAVETTGAVIVLGVVDLVSDLSTFSTALTDNKVQNQVGPVLSHKRSLIAEESQLHDTIDRCFVDALTGWLDPHPPATAVPIARMEKPKEEKKRPSLASSKAEEERSGISGWFGGKSREELNYKERIIQKFYDKEHLQQRRQPAVEIEEEEEKREEVDEQADDGVKRREISVSDVQELFWNLLGEDLSAYDASQKAKAEGPSVNKNNMKEGATDRSKPLEELERKYSQESQEVEDKYLLFPNLKKFKDATKFPSLEGAVPEEEPVAGPQPADAPKIKGDPSKQLLCRILSANVELLNHLEVLEGDFGSADEQLESSIVSLCSSGLPPEQAVSQALREIYLASIALIGYFYAARRLFPLPGASAAGAGAGAVTGAGGAGILAESSATASAAASSFLAPLLRSSNGGTATSWARGLASRAIFSPFIFLPLLTMYATRVLGNPDATERWETFAKRLAYVHPSQLEALEKERMEKRGDEEFESLFAKSATPVWAGATAEDPFTWSRVKFALLSKPVAETLLYTGVLFRSLLQIPGLSGLGVAAANVMSAAIYGSFMTMTEHSGRHQAANWYEKEGGMRDYGLFRVTMAQQLALQCLFLTTSGTFLSLGRPLAYLMAANTCMLLAEMQQAVSAPGFRMDEFGPYRSLVDIWLKNMQATYFRLSREPVDEASKRLATHCAGYIFWLRGTAGPLRVSRDATDVVKEEGSHGDAQRALVDEEDLVSASLMDERRYRHTQETGKKECTLVDLHSFLVAAEHLLDTFTLHRDPQETPPESLKPFEQWQTPPQSTMHTLNSLGSKAIIQTVFGTSASLPPPQQHNKEDEKEAAENKGETKAVKKESSSDEVATETVMDMNNRRIAASKRRDPPSAWGFQHLFSVLDDSYRHAWFEFLKIKYRGRKLTFDEVEAELPKLLKMVETVPNFLSPGLRRPESLQAQVPLLDAVANSRERTGYPSKQGMPSLLDYVPMAWDHVQNDTTHEAMLDLVDGMYTRLRRERVTAAKAFGEREGRVFWNARAGKGRPTRSDMARERDRMLRHVSAVTSKDCHDFLGSLGFTRYRLSLGAHRFAQKDSSHQLQKLTQSWEGYLKSKEHYEEVHRAFIEELMKGKPKQRYLQARG